MDNLTNLFNRIVHTPSMVGVLQLMDRKGRGMKKSCQSLSKGAEENHEKCDL
jgi:hypothetical protein